MCGRVVPHGKIKIYPIRIRLRFINICQPTTVQPLSLPDQSQESKIFVEGVILDNTMRGMSERYIKFRQERRQISGKRRRVGRESEGDSESRHYI